MESSLRAQSVDATDRLHRLQHRDLDAECRRGLDDGHARHCIGGVVQLARERRRRDLSGDAGTLRLKLATPRDADTTHSNHWPEPPLLVESTPSGSRGGEQSLGFLSAWRRSETDSLDCRAEVGIWIGL
jgi:hypothetical protein